MKRIYIFTGKGGVGKSSVAAAHAMKSAEEGQKTLLISTDMAHNLGDIFGRKLGKEEETVLPNLDIYEIDPEYVMQNDFKEFMDYVKRMISSTGEMDDMGMMPGMEELFALLKISEIYKKGTYDRIVVDCAPTGETLSMLKFPELMSWYMEKLFPIGKVGVRVLAPFSKKLFKMEMPNKQAMNDIEKVFLKLMDLQELLKNRDITSVRIVTTPEKMVVEETKRNYMYMNLYNFNVDGLYINRILPQDIDNRFFDRWVEPGLIDSLKTVAGENFARITYREAISILQKSGKNFEYPVSYGIDLQTEHERYLSEEHFKKPTMVTDYPRNIKAFYMRANDDGDTVAAMDLLVPRIGELIGGSQREERYDLLRDRILAMGQEASSYDWYLDLRRFGSVPHSGFGMGFERFIMMLTGVSNIRDVIPFPRTPGSLEF